MRSVREQWMFKAVYLEKSVRLSLLGTTWIMVDPTDPDTGEPDAYLAWKLAAGKAMRFTKGRPLLSLDLICKYTEGD